MSSIADIRKDYKLQSLSEEDVAGEPIEQFRKWWDEAIRAQIEEVNAMTLATASAEGIPSARIVLLKGLTDEGFTFFTNYESYKGRQLEDNPRACLVFFWKELERQVRVTGITEKLGAEESDAYFGSRPLLSRIGAWASPQSQVIESRAWLELENETFTREFADQMIKRPPYWGGYRVKPLGVEFWQGRRNRLHDRIQFLLQEDGTWKRERLAP